MKLKPVLLACLAVLAPGAAHAQYQMMQPSLYMGPQISLQAHANTTRSTQQRRAVPSPVDRAVQGSEADAPVDMALMMYRPDAARRRSNLAQFVEKTRATDPASADNLQKMFAQGDFIQRLQGAAAPLGLRVDNVADGYSIYWINAWLATRGRNDTPSRQRFEAVRQQAARALGATEEFRGASDATKQELSEALWVQAALLDGAVEKYRNDPKQLKAVGVAAAQGAKAMGLDLTTMELTDDGFVPKSAADASSVAAKLASADGEAPAQKSGGSYGLIAAAAVAGSVGGAAWMGRRRG